MYPELLTSKTHSSLEIMICCWNLKEDFLVNLLPIPYFNQNIFLPLCDCISMPKFASGSHYWGVEECGLSHSRQQTKTSLLAGGSKNWASQLINCQKQISKKILIIGKNQTETSVLVPSSQKTDWYWRMLTEDREATPTSQWWSLWKQNQGQMPQESHQGYGPALILSDKKSKCA